ncbi:Xanthine dehydrogenase [Crinalium epipsammum PCC 9333]|uniref:Xanthine dehydrogenase n=1 Tax=Crinalium epipsammum PCC 9333 TaxID=1173022 RepID=K9VWK8_9CYAN|nr:XdhC/CoxI family protein [Crinalium epipsammum]AFZ12371.1 Xanthine dehydrogenase [Crinalium epipsammum PCC 9333]
MKELQDILKTFEQIKHSRSAIATVVKTSGSVYRRPGARMLITESGQMVGAISGGCLESDIVERSQPLILHNGEPILVEYDTTASNDLVWGLGMGCNGTVQVLIESLHCGSAQNQLEFIAECFRYHQPGVVATVFDIKGEVAASIASRLYLHSDGTVKSEIGDRQLAAYLQHDAYGVLTEGKTKVVSYSLDHGSVDVLIEVIRPPVPLLVFGAGYDAVPIVQLAKQLGWHVTVIDRRPAYATRDRFPDADEIIVCHPEELSTKLNLNPQMVAVVLTHNYLSDQMLLQTLLPSPVRYLGLLGAKPRSQQLLEDLRKEGFIPSKNQLQRLYAPVGLDIGAETAAEIALSVVAEIQAVLAQREGNHLRFRQGSIHGETEPCLTLV